jgi:hypothetical protein
MDHHLPTVDAELDEPLLLHQPRPNALRRHDPARERQPRDLAGVEVRAATLHGDRSVT